MKFEMSNTNEFKGVYNNGTNDVIPVMIEGYPHTSVYFMHDTSSTNENPAGYGTNNGRYGTGSDVARAREASEAIQSWNNANAAYNNGNGGSSGFVNDHYVRRGDSAMGMFATSKFIENKPKTNHGLYNAWKTGPEILNGGSFAISSGDHLMIKVNRQSIEYFKNGSIVHTQSNSGNGRVGGVTTLRRKLVIGKNSNNINSSFTIKKFNWHGNGKTLSEAQTIYNDRDFILSGGSGVTNIDLTPYINGAAIVNNVLELSSANATVSLPLRDSYLKSQTYLKSEIDALISAEIALITDVLSNYQTVFSDIIADVSGLSTDILSNYQSIAQLNTQVSNLTSSVANLGGSGSGGGWNPF